VSGKPSRLAQEIASIRHCQLEPDVIDILVQSHCDSRAAERFFRKILRVEGTLPRRVITDRLGSYGLAKERKGKERKGKVDAGCRAHQGQGSEQPS
jgi:putative transposase